MWASVERVIGRIQAVSAQVRALQRVLLRKRSQTVHLTFAELVEVRYGAASRMMVATAAWRILFSKVYPAS